MECRRLRITASEASVTSQAKRRRLRCGIPNGMRSCMRRAVKRGIALSVTEICLRSLPRRPLDRARSAIGRLALSGMLIYAFLVTYWCVLCTPFKSNELVGWILLLCSSIPSRPPSEGLTRPWSVDLRLSSVWNELLPPLVVLLSYLEPIPTCINHSSPAYSQMS
jgi:hypothetical protein